MQDFVKSSKRWSFQGVHEYHVAVLIFFVLKERQRVDADPTSTSGLGGIVLLLVV